MCFDAVAEKYPLQCLLTLTRSAACWLLLCVLGCAPAPKPPVEVGPPSKYAPYELPILDRSTYFTVKVVPDSAHGTACYVYNGNLSCVKVGP